MNIAARKYKPTALRRGSSKSMSPHHDAEQQQPEAPPSFNYEAELQRVVELQRKADSELPEGWQRMPHYNRRFQWSQPEEDKSLVRPRERQDAPPRKNNMMMPIELSSGDYHTGAVPTTSGKLRVERKSSFNDPEWGSRRAEEKAALLLKRTIV